MIFDRLDNFGLYLSLHPLFEDAGRFMQRYGLNGLLPGRYEVGDRGVFALVSEYATKDPAACFIECHRRYIDIQFLPEGREKVGICSRQDCRAEEYDQEKDFQKLHGETDLITLRPGLFAIFFPDDGHMPQMSFADRPENVRKVVIKVPV